MRKRIVGFFTLALLAVWTGAALSGDEDAARAVIARAIKAGGGAEKLATFESAVMKEKGTYYGMGEGLPYTSVIHVQKPDRFKMEIAGVFTQCLDGDKGWMKSDKGVTDLPKDQVELEQINQKASWIMSLLSLQEKAYKLQPTGEAELDGMKTTVIKVSREGYPTVDLYFDKKTDHLVKSQFLTKSSEQKGKQVKAEFLFSNFKTVDGVTMPYRVVLKHDNKLYVEGEVLEMKAVKHDAKTFAKPASE